MGFGVTYASLTLTLQIGTLKIDLGAGAQAPARLGAQSATTQGKKGDENRRAMMKPTPRRGMQSESQSGSRRPPPKGRWFTLRRAMTARQRCREQRNNPKQPKKNKTMKNTRGEGEGGRQPPSQSAHGVMMM